MRIEIMYRGAKLASLLKGPHIISDLVDEDVLYIGTRVYIEKNGMRTCDEKHRYPISKEHMENIAARLLYSKIKQCEVGFEQEFTTPIGKFKMKVEWVEKEKTNHD